MSERNTRFTWEPTDIAILMSDEWSEEDHPRDPGGEGGGQFTSGGGGLSLEEPEVKPDQGWKTAKEAEEGFQAKHGITVRNNEDNPLKGDRYVDTVKNMDNTMDGIKAKFPHVDEFKSLHGGVYLTNGRSIEHTVGGMPARSFGLYRSNEGTIELAGSLKHNEAKLKFGSFQIAENSSGVYRHELGHALESKLLFSARQNGVVPKDFSLAKHFVEQKAGGAKQLSTYGMTNSKEYFAESFAAYSHPGYASSVKKIHPTMEKIFDQMKKPRNPT